MNKTNLLLTAAFAMAMTLGATHATAQYLYVTNTGTSGTSDSLSIINTTSGLVQPIVSSTYLDNPTGIALDSYSGNPTYAGDLFIANEGNNTIVTYNPSTGVFANYASLGAGTSPVGIAFDSKGNLYIASSPTNSTGGIYDISVGTSSKTVNTYTSTTLAGPQGIAIDGNGNLFVTLDGKTANSKIVEIGAGGTVNAFYPGSNSSSTTLTNPLGITFNTLPTSGDLFIADFSGNDIVRSTLYPVGSVAVASTGQSMSDPTGLIFDASGDLFVADYGTNSVTEYTENGTTGTYTLSKTFNGGGLNGPAFLAFDTQGLPVPEPGTYALLLGGLAMLFFMRRRRTVACAKI